MTLTKEITNAILSAAESSKKIINMNSSCKDWWNIFKQISGIKGSDMSIPPPLLLSILYHQ
jgi:hypothetical protein